MNNSELALQALRNSIGVVLYVAGVAWLMSNGEELFGNTPGILGMLAFLMLFIFSALVTGLLVFGWPIWTYLQGRKTDAVKLLGLTVAALFVETVAVLALIAVF